MTRVLWVIVPMLWLSVLVRVVRLRRRARPDRRLLLALETLRTLPQPRTGSHDDAESQLASR